MKSTDSMIATTDRLRQAYACRWCVLSEYTGLKSWNLKGGVVYGPFRTRRQGNSLGINLLAPMRKHCTFNCVYCQCGWTRAAVPSRPEDFADYPSPRACARRGGGSLW